jgi:hypothetical protein
MLFTYNKIRLVRNRNGFKINNNDILTTVNINPNNYYYVAILYVIGVDIM